MVKYALGNFLYLLKEHPRPWFGRLVPCRLKLDYEEAHMIIWISFLCQPLGSILLVLYVYDFAITRSDDTRIKNLKTFLGSEIQKMDLGPLGCFFRD